MFTVSRQVQSFNKIAEPGIDLDSLSVSFFYQCSKKVKLLIALGDGLRETFALPIDLTRRTFDHDHDGIDVRLLATIDELPRSLRSVTNGRRVRPQCVYFSFGLRTVARICNTQEMK